ncbi:MAG: hypothetical protein ACO3N7_06965 [Kiritimatiellia bacterium]
MATAICRSVDPYRRDLENKSKLLNDAVEMVKVRNERIRDVETLMLNTQKELWQLEYELNALQKASTVEKTLAEAAPPSPSAPSLLAKIEELEQKKEKLKAKLTTMVAHSENLEQNYNELRSVVRDGGPVLKMIDSMSALISQELQEQENQNRDLDLATAYLTQAAQELQNLQRHLTEKENQRQQMEELVSSSTQDMNLAVEERNQWRKKATDLEKKYIELQETEKKLRLQTSELEKLQAELSEDRDHSTHLHTELEENLDLLRKRIDQERAMHQEAMEDREAKLKTDAQKKISLLENKLKAANAELDAMEEKLTRALQTQQQLAEQNMQGEMQRRQLKAELETLRGQFSGQ